jgi:hypothetical protein
MTGMDTGIPDGTGIFSRHEFGVEVSDCPNNSFAHPLTSCVSVSDTLNVVLCPAGLEPPPRGAPPTRVAEELCIISETVAAALLAEFAGSVAVTVAVWPDVIPDAGAVYVVAVAAVVGLVESVPPPATVQYTLLLAVNVRLCVCSSMPVAGDTVIEFWIVFSMATTRLPSLMYSCDDCGN